MLSVRRWENANCSNVYYLEATILLIFSLPSMAIVYFLIVKLGNEIIVKFAKRKYLFPNPKLYNFLEKMCEKKDN